MAMNSCARNLSHQPEVTHATIRRSETRPRRYREVVNEGGTNLMTYRTPSQCVASLGALFLLADGVSESPF